MSESLNPFLVPEDYTAEYKKQVDNANKDPKTLDYHRLTYALFKSKDGEEWLDGMVERYLIPGFVNPAAVTAPHAALYYEGFKECIRMIKNAIRAHEQFIESESLKR